MDSYARQISLQLLRRVKKQCLLQCIYTNFKIDFGLGDFATKRTLTRTSSPPFSVREFDYVSFYLHCKLRAHVYIYIILEESNSKSSYLMSKWKSYSSFILVMLQSESASSWCVFQQVRTRFSYYTS